MNVFGVLDASVTRLTVDNGGSQTIIDGTGRNASSRLGFRGVEDLGGGLSAAFWLEAAINVDNGTGSNSSLNNTAGGDRVAFGSTGATIINPQATLGARQGLTFNRASTISLISRTAGELRVGRDYNPAFWNYTVYDPFGTVGVGSALNVIGGTLAPVGVQAFPPGAAYPMVRTSNSIGWLSQNMNGFRAQLQYALSEMPTICQTPQTNVNGNSCWDSSGDGKVTAGRLSYAAGKLTTAVAYSKTTYADNAASAQTLLALPAGTSLSSTALTVNSTNVNALSNATAIRGNYTQTNLGAAYDLGFARVMAQYGTQVQAASGAANQKKLTNYLIGTVVPMGQWSFKASYNQAKRDDSAGSVSGANEIGSKVQQYALGVQYDFSKRTAFYSTYSNNKLTAGSTTVGGATGIRSTLGLNGPVLGAGQSGTSTGLDIGIRHSF